MEISIKPGWLSLHTYSTSARTVAMEVYLTFQRVMSLHMIPLPKYLCERAGSFRYNSLRLPPFTNLALGLGSLVAKCGVSQPGSHRQAFSGVWWYQRPFQCSQPTLVHRYLFCDSFQRKERDRAALRAAFGVLPVLLLAYNMSRLGPVFEHFKLKRIWSKMLYFCLLFQIYIPGSFLRIFKNARYPHWI